MIIRFDFKDHNLNDLWVSYQEKKEIGMKKEANKILNKFVGDLEQKDDFKLRGDFAKTLLGKIYDEDIRFELQYPLLKNIIFPFLIGELRKKSMPEIRWLCQIPYIDIDATLEIDRLVHDNEPREKLLLLALDIDKEDKKAQELLLKYYINYLDFSIHELPAGLLCKVEEGLDVISKAYSLLDKYNYGTNIECVVKELLALCRRLIIEWSSFTNQNEIKDFDDWCVEHNFDYVDCRTKTWEIRRTYF